MAARTPLSHGTPMTASFSYFRRPPHVMAAAVVALALSAAPAFAQAALTPELEAAVQAVQRATQADADQYAPDLIASARAHLEQAQAASMDRRAQKQVPALATQPAGMATPEPSALALPDSSTSSTATSTASSPCRGTAAKTLAMIRSPPSRLSSRPRRR